MAHIPTYCDACSRSALLPATDIRNGLATCAECGSETRTVPGASYGEQDVPLYAELATALREARITPWNAVQLLDQATATVHSAPGQLLSHLAKTLPSLSVLLIHRNSGATRKIDAMLATLLRALGTGRSPSDIPPAQIATPRGDEQ